MFKHIGDEAEVAVFSNGFALDRMIQGCALATDTARLLQALQRLNGFVKHNHADLSDAQRTSIEAMAAKHQARGATVWDAEVATAYEAFMGGTVASEHEAASSRRASRAEELGVGASGASGVSGARGGAAAALDSSSEMTPYTACPPGRKLFCRIDRENTVRHRTYRLFLQAMYADVDPDQAVEHSAELYMLSSRKVKASMKVSASSQPLF